MDERELREALTKHEEFRAAEAVWLAQFLLLSAAIGYAMKSWWAFGISLFAFMVLTWIPIARRIMAIGAALLWGSIGWEAGRGRDLGMSVVLAIIFFVVGLGFNEIAVRVYDEKDAKEKSKTRR